MKRSQLPVGNRRSGRLHPHHLSPPPLIMFPAGGGVRHLMDERFLHSIGVCAANINPAFLKADQPAADMTAVDWLIRYRVKVKNDAHSVSVQRAGEVLLVKTVEQ